MMDEKDESAPARLTASDSEAASARDSVPSAASEALPVSAPANPTPSVPDGGWEAWLVVFGSMIVMIHTWGLINSFGVFQTYYETDLLKDNSSSDISWIGSIQAALLMMGGVVSGPLFDAGHFRALLIGGNFMVVFGMFMTSLCTTYWQFVLAQGICVGLGCAMMFLPTAAIMSQWFAKRRALALGVQSVGSPVAGIFLPVIFSRLQPQLGFAWATRVMAFVLLALSVLPIIFMKTRVPPPSQKRPFIDKSALRDIPFLLFGAAGFFAFAGLYVPFFYLQLYSLERGISSAEFSPYFVTLLNVGSIFGRLVPNYLADYLGSMNLLMVTTFLAALLAFSWLGISNFPGLIVFSILYGAFSGGVVSITPSAIVPYCPNMSSLGTRMGMAFFASGISVLIGTPIGGAILGHGGGSSWTGIITYSGSTLLIGGLLWSLSWTLRHRQLKLNKP